ncbi:hypothetical protein LZ554_005900 [Drepanopeziza brunnea f. sp. 'monogermtubi']|nr:hypothetical protein LZ554_005900 [Drepanopeziza brunnea f. sp. 'monogermtubi']
MGRADEARTVTEWESKKAQETPTLMDKVLSAAREEVADPLPTPRESTASHGSTAEIAENLLFEDLLTGRTGSTGAEKCPNDRIQAVDLAADLAKFDDDDDGSSGRDPASGQHSNAYRPIDCPKKPSLIRRMEQWFWNVGGLVASVAILATIAVILRYYDGQIQPSWRFSFNLNSLVAILMTVMRTTMMEVVSDSMSQLKWNWFSQPRKLRHLEIFDEGSRGPWGSVKLMARIRRPHPVLLGAAITILSLATGLFAQQAVISVPCVIQENSTHGTIPFRRHVSSFDVYRIGAGLWILDYSTKAALIDAIANPTGNNSAVNPSCPTGNCTFASYGGATHSSIGLCTQCVDVTSTATQSFSNDTTFTSGGVNFTLPNGLAISSTIPAGTGNTYIDAKWETALNYSRTDASADVGSLSVLQFTASDCTQESGSGSSSARTCPPQSHLPNRTATMSVLGVKCSYQVCLKNYEARIVAGRLNENITSTVLAPASYLQGINLANVNFTTAKIPCVINGVAYSLAEMSALKSPNMTFVSVPLDGQNVTVPEQCVYGISEIYLKALSDFLTSSMTGNGIVSSASGAANPNFYSENWWLAALYRRGNASFGSVRASLENLATTFTNDARAPRGNLLAEYATPQLMAAFAPATIQGVGERTVICARFHWPWLLFPAGLILATAVLLCMTTALRYYGALGIIPNWKASLLPLLYYGLLEDRRVEGASLRSARDGGGDTDAAAAVGANRDGGYGRVLERGELEAVADRTVVRFRRTADGAGFEDMHSSKIGR